MVRYLCEITTHKGQASTHLHHLVLLNKEKNKNPKKFATKKKQFNIVAVWFFKQCVRDLNP